MIHSKDFLYFCKFIQNSVSNTPKNLSRFSSNRTAKQLATQCPSPSISLQCKFSSDSRSSHTEVFLGKRPCRSVISIKLLCNFIEIVLRHGLHLSGDDISVTTMQSSPSLQSVIMKSLSLFVFVKMPIETGEI